MQDPEGKTITFLHEVLHAILDDRDMGLDVNAEEKIVEGIAKGLFDVLTNWE